MFLKVQIRYSKLACLEKGLDICIFLKYYGGFDGQLRLRVIDLGVDGLQRVLILILKGQLGKVMIIFIVQIWKLWFREVK